MAHPEQRGVEGLPPLTIMNQKSNIEHQHPPATSPVPVPVSVSVSVPEWNSDGDS
jgi:hypothetical protein